MPPETGCQVIPWDERFLRKDHLPRNAFFLWRPPRNVGAGTSGTVSHSFIYYSHFWGQKNCPNQMYLLPHPRSATESVFFDSKLKKNFFSNKVNTDPFGEMPQSCLPSHLSPLLTGPGCPELSLRSHSLKTTDLKPSGFPWGHGSPLPWQNIRVYSPIREQHTRA